MNAPQETKIQTKITQLQIKGLRSLKDITLDLNGLIALIGSNGSGKSSIVEACELLRRLHSPNFIDEFYKIHGGFSQLLRHDSSAITLQISGAIEVGERLLTGHSEQAFLYQVTLKGTDDGYVALTEQLSRSATFLSAGFFSSLETKVDRGPNTLAFNERTETHTPLPLALTTTNLHHQQITEPTDTEVTSWEAPIHPHQLLLHFQPPESSPSSFLSATRTVIEALKQIDVHIPFDVSARWVRKAFRKSSELRESAESAPTTALAITGHNLVNAYHALKNEFSSAHWNKTMDYVRLGLGNDIDSINTRVGGGGDMGLSIKYHAFDKQVSTTSLSDGELAYLAFVALFRLNHNKSLLVFDEPDLHLHPRLTMRVLDLFESMAADGMPVLITTHSDRLLDGLRDPARSVILCELNEARATELYRPDPIALADWLTDYRGIGSIRNDGHEASVLTEKITPKQMEP